LLPGTQGHFVLPAQNHSREKKPEIDIILVHLLKLNQITDFLDCAQIKQE
jgi:hypothetical protein